MIELRHAYPAVNGIRVHYARTNGGGPKLVLLHGWPEFVGSPGTELEFAL